MEQKRIDEIKEFVEINLALHTPEVKKYYESLNEKEQRLFDKEFARRGGGDMWYKVPKPPTEFPINFK
jgi:hypothetical protein